MQPFWAELSHSERFSEAQLVVLTSDTDSGIGKLDTKGGAEKLCGRQKEKINLFQSTCCVLQLPVTAGSKTS